MTEDPFYIKMAKLELRRLDAEERYKESERAYEEREHRKMERYLNAPIMGLDGKIIKKST